MLLQDLPDFGPLPVVRGLDRGVPHLHVRGCEDLFYQVGTPFRGSGLMQVPEC